MSGILTEIQAFAVEEEATSGTAETIEAADALLAEEATIKPTREMLPRNVVTDDATKKAPIPGGASCAIAATVELKGSGTAGTKNDPLCDLLETMGITMTADAGYAVRGAFNKTLSSVKSATMKAFLDGKYVTAKGCRGGGTFELASGQPAKLVYDGMGVFEAPDDVAVLAGPSDSPKPDVWINGKMALLEHHAACEYDCDGDGALLRGTAGYGAELTKYFTQGSTTQKVLGAFVKLKKIGTPANSTNGFALEIQDDSGGDPDGSEITNGLSSYIATTAISDTDWEWYFVEFGSHGNRPSLTASTTWHVVYTGDWDQDDSNCISVETDVVTAGNQAGKEYDGAAWNAMALENPSLILLVAPDVENYIDTVSIMPNNGVVLRKDPSATEGYREAIITNRGDGIKLNVSPLEKLDSEQSFWDELTNATTMALVAHVGDVAGNIIEFNVLECKISNAEPWDDRDGEAAVPLELHVEDSDLIELVFK